LKIPLKGFFLAVFYSAAVSSVSYILLFIFLKKFMPFVILISIALFLTLFYLSASYFKTFSAVLSKGSLLVKKGFFIKRKNHVNLKYALSAKVITTPLMRLLGLSNLLLIFEGSVCFLPLLRYSDAENIFLKSRENK